MSSVIETKEIETPAKNHWERR